MNGLCVYIYTNKNIYAYMCIYIYKIIKEIEVKYLKEQGGGSGGCIGWFGERKRKRKK